MTAATTAKPLLTAPARYRVIDGALYARHQHPYAFDIRVHELGHGHTEATVQPRFAWGEVDALSPGALSDYAMAAQNIFVASTWEKTPPPSGFELLDKLARNRDRSTRRARTKVRRLCKNRGLSVMLTLTYRENMTDRQRMARDFDVFVKRLRRVVPDFQYVCVFEKQKRGAYHAHIAVPRVLSHYLHKGSLMRSYDFLRSVWRAVVGVDNGNVDVSRNKRISRSPSRLAAYLAKYIGKDIASDGEGDSYRASGRDLPKPVVIRILSADEQIAFGAAWDLLAPERHWGEFHSAFLDGGGAFISISAA